MHFSKDAIYADAIKAAPGPVPWYMGQPASNFSTPSLALQWERDPDAGPSALKDAKGNIYALASIYTYVFRYSDEHFIVWFHEVPRNTNNQLLGKVRFELYPLEHLTPLPNIDISRQRLKARDTSFIAASPAIAESSAPRHLGAGDREIEFSPVFDRCHELFVLVSDPAWDSTQLNLWIINPAQNRISVIAQDWFTRGPYDFGYQWVTRITREPTTRNIVGDGIRIGSFLLNSDGTTFTRWLNK